MSEVSEKDSVNKNERILSGTDFQIFSFFIDFFFFCFKFNFIIYSFNYDEQKNQVNNWYHAAQGAQNPQLYSHLSWIEIGSDYSVPEGNQFYHENPYEGFDVIILIEDYKDNGNCSCKQKEFK